jgi:hypothetical protein
MGLILGLVTTWNLTSELKFVFSENLDLRARIFLSGLDLVIHILHLTILNALITGTDLGEVL